MLVSIQSSGEELILIMESATQIKSAKLPNDYCMRNFSYGEKDRINVCTHSDNGSWDIFEGTVGEVISGSYSQKKIKFAFARSYFYGDQLSNFYIRLRKPNSKYEKFLETKYVVKEYSIERHAMVCFEDQLPQAFSAANVLREGSEYCYSILRLHKS